MQVEIENKWPDEIRFRMIEKSEFYPGGESIYQYGFYDGYQCQIKSNKIEQIESEIIKKLLADFKKISAGLAPLLEYSLIN